MTNIYMLFLSVLIIGCNHRDSKVKPVVSPQNNAYSKDIEAARALFTSDRMSILHPASEELRSNINRVISNAYNNKCLDDLYKEGLVYDVQKNISVIVTPKMSDGWRTWVNCSASADNVDYYGEFARVLLIEKWPERSTAFPLYWNKKGAKWVMLDGGLTRRWPILWRRALYEYMKCLEIYRIDLERDNDPNPPKYPEGYSDRDVMIHVLLIEKAYEDARKVPIEAWVEMLNTNALEVRRRAYDQLRERTKAPYEYMGGYFRRPKGYLGDPLPQHKWEEQWSNWLSKRRGQWNNYDVWYYEEDRNKLEEMRENDNKHEKKEKE